ncbi:RebB family R body protein, partial [Listeria seeligeri]|uniref:RebB family R body protein n=1 Tax=Listeria seeligeri TaxID=1640 RepID=UPI0022EA3AFE
VAQGPAQSFSMLDMVMLETLGTAMHNAVARQQGAGMVSNAAVTAACAKMINAPWPVPPPPPLPPPPPPPPEVFTTAEVRRLRPEIVTADRKWDQIDADLQQRVLAI